MRPRRLVRIIAIAAFAFAAWETLSWPRVADLAQHDPKTTAFIEQWKDQRRAAGKSDTPEWRWAPYAAISPHLKRAVLVSEDINFFGHRGFEVAEMKAAVKEAVEEHEIPRGASTITQQVAKNLWLSPSRNPLRKVKEASSRSTSTSPSSATASTAPRPRPAATSARARRISTKARPRRSRRACRTQRRGIRRAGVRPEGGARRGSSDAWRRPSSCGRRSEPLRDATYGTEAGIGDLVVNALRAFSSWAARSPGALGRPSAPGQ
jgi:hypothetical protein